MKRRGHVTAIAVLALVLTACGQQPAAIGDETTGTASASAASGMEHGGMASATGEASTMSMASAPAAASGEATESDGGGMDHGAMGSPDATAPYDARFIDSMVAHHQGAITMAEQARDASERPQILQLAEAILATQQDEIDRMEGWRTDWYAGLAPTGGMDMDMGDMDISDDASVPFDQRFITAMVAHHQGAIDMARDAQQNAEHQEIKDLAGAIITAQEAEIAQMEQWQQEWFGQ